MFQIFFLAGSFPKQADCSIVGYGKQKRLERRIDIDFIPGFPDFNKNLLNNFFGIGFLFYVSQNKPIQSSAIAFIELIKSYLVVFTNKQQQFFIGFYNFQSRLLV